MKLLYPRMAMDQNNPFEEIFQQINDLLQKVADNADKPLSEEVPMDIEAKLGALERRVEAFKRANKTYIAQLGITDEDMQAYLAMIGKSRGGTKSPALERTEKLKKEIEVKKEFLQNISPAEETAQGPDISISEQKLQEKKSPNTRKNLFKRVGGNKNWRPL